MDELLVELRALIARHASPHGLRSAALPSVTLTAAHAPTAPSGYVAGSQITFIAQGAKIIAYGDRTLRYGPGQYIVLSVDIPLVAYVLRADIDEPYLGICLDLKRDVITSLLLETSQVPPTSVEFRAPSVNDATIELIDPLVRFLRLLDRPADIPVLAAGIEREIIWRLMMGHQGDIIRQLSLPDSHIAQIGRAAQWIREHHVEPFRVGDLAAMVGMSATSFHRHFRAVTSLTPIQYQKHIRLHAARSQFLAGRLDVTAVGYSIGYNSPSQFSRDYRHLFGKPPVADARGSHDTAAASSLDEELA